MEAATQRRLREELGLACELKFPFKFRYHAQFDEDRAERDLCGVFMGGSTHRARASLVAPPGNLKRRITQAMMSQS